MSNIKNFCYKSTILYTKVRLIEFKYFDSYFYKQLDKYSFIKSFFKFFKFLLKSRNSVLVYYGTSGVPQGFITVNTLNNKSIVNFTLYPFNQYYRFDELIPILLFVGFDVNLCNTVNIYTENENCIHACLVNKMTVSKTDAGTYCYMYKNNYTNVPIVCEDS